MGVVTNGLPAAAAHGNRTVVVVAIPAGGLWWASWDLGSGPPVWTPVQVNGYPRSTDVAPAVSFRTTASGYTVWLAIKDSGDKQIYEALQLPDSNFNGWTLLPGVPPDQAGFKGRTNVSPVVSDGNLAIGFPIMAALAAPPDGSTYLNVYLSDQPPYPAPPEYWKAVIPSPFTAMAPALAVVGNASYMYLAATIFNFVDAPLRVVLNQGNPFDPDQLVGWQEMEFKSNLPPVMSAANNRTFILAVNPRGIIFYNWWDFGGGGHGWVPLGDDVRTKVPPAVALLDNGDYMFVLAQGLDGELHINQVGAPFRKENIIGWERAG